MNAVKKNGTADSYQAGNKSKIRKPQGENMNPTFDDSISQLFTMMNKDGKISGLNDDETRILNIFRNLEKIDRQRFLNFAEMFAC